jgi:hypothetical protein
MAESSLSLAWSDFKSEVGYYLGMGRGVATAWSVSQLAEISAVVQSGIRQVYYPPAVSADTLAYEWSWLRPTSMLAISVAGGYDYDLPDEFCRLIGELSYPDNEYRNPIAVIAVGKLLALRANSDLTSGAPQYAATRYKTSTGSAGQKQEILFWPTPDASWTLLYEYEAYSGALSDSCPYPLGGMQLAELYLESCLAVAESRITDAPGTHTKQFGSLLLDRIARDRKRGAQLYGQMGQPGCGCDYTRCCNVTRPFSITYKGVEL